jgi:hypothetical protein
MVLVRGRFGKYFRCANHARGCDICQHASGRGEPKGDQTDQPTRTARRQAHAQFDLLWEKGVFPSRGEAYTWLAAQLGVARIHIAQSDIETCRRIAELSHARFIEGIREGAA